MRSTLDISTKATDEADRKAAKVLGERFIRAKDEPPDAVGAEAGA